MPRRCRGKEGCYSFWASGREVKRDAAGAIVAGDPTIGRAAQEDADKPAKVRHFMQGRNKANHHPKATDRINAAMAFGLKLVAIPVLACGVASNKSSTDTGRA